MFFLKRAHKFTLRQSYCRFCISAKVSPQVISNEKNTKVLLKTYEEKLLYNSVIESKRMRYGFKKNSQIIQEQLRFEERMNTALQTVQPLPLTLKYHITEDGSNKCEEITSETTLPEAEMCQEINVSTYFPYNINAKINEDNVNQEKEFTAMSVEQEIIGKKKLLDRSKENWMTHYENYEKDLVSDNDNETSVAELEDWKVNYGSPDPNCPISNQPCGGCGAHLHCKDTAIPGYIPSEIFKNSFSPGGANLASILCQRCHFLNEYNIALQVRVSPDDYPKVLQAISLNRALAVLMVDLTDFPCSIWPGIADILGDKVPIVVVGNKVDLLPRDHPKYLKTITAVLLENLKLNGFASSNIKHIQLISAKTGYGVEDLISALHRVWKNKGDIYLIGCTNVGKSSLFNQLLQSDLCKIQAADLIQRATTSPWPGTTLNLLKFPVTRFSGYRLYEREKRLEQLKKIETEHQNLNREALKEHNSAKYATLMGRVERSVEHEIPKYESTDGFSMQGSQRLSGKTQMGVNETLPEFVYGKWCYDTPGVIHPDQILHLLTTDELILTLPKEIIRPETYCVKPGNTLFIAGLARLDYVQGPNSIRLTIFRAHSLPITICKTDEADSIYNELLGSELFTVPILNGDRAQKWPGLEIAKTFKVFGKNVKESSYDVVLSSAGWVAINCGLNHYELKAWTPEKRGVYVRDSLLPRAVTLRGLRIRDSVAYKKHRFV